MKEYITFSKIYEDYLAGVCPSTLVAETVGLLGEDEDWKDLIRYMSSDPSCPPVSWVTGGIVAICESEDDMREACIDVPGIWDYINRSCDENGRPWAVFFRVTSNSGGPCYYIPETLLSERRFEEIKKENRNASV